MTTQKTKKFRLSPTMVIIWITVALISAVATWLVLMGDDAKIYRVSPSSPIPQPMDEASQQLSEQKIDNPLFAQSKLSVDSTPNTSKIGIIVTNLGLQHDLTQHALANLPPYTTVSFSPYTHNKNELFKKALSNQHEVMIDIPMTLTGDDVCDGGPCAVEASLSAAENYRKIKRILTGAHGCIGLNCFDMHANAEKIVQDLIPHFKSDPLLLVAHMKERTTDLPSSIITPLAFQEDATEEVLMQQLAQAEQNLTTDKPQILIGRASPTLIETLQKWGDTLPAKNIQLMPLSYHSNS